MEGLRLLDESQRDGGAEAEPAAAAQSASAPASGAPASQPSAAAKPAKEEEEDVLLDG